MRRLKEITKKTTRTIAVLAFLLTLMAAGLATFTRKSPAQEAAVSEIPSGFLMLVRAWDPNTRELIGWMPMHRVAITLKQLEEGRTPSFNLNEAVTADFPYRPRDAVKYGQLRVVHETATFEGREWTPLEQTPNLVRIHKLIFYVKSIDFGESKWRSATVPSPSTPTQGK